MRGQNERSTLAHHLQVTNNSTGLVKSVVSIEGEVHVGLGIAREDGSTDHLNQRHNVGGEPSDGVDGDDERQEDTGEENANDQSPPWKIRLAGVDGTDGHNKAAEECCNVPPHRDLGVNFHLSEMRVVVFSTL